jgi:hypothetical protein
MLAANCWACYRISRRRMVQKVCEFVDGLNEFIDYFQVDQQNQSGRGSAARKQQQQQQKQVAAAKMMPSSANENENTQNGGSRTRARSDAKQQVC